MSDSSKRWGMTIDLNRCVGCQTCTIACKHANDTSPGVQWRRVVDMEFGQYPDVQRLFMVTGCQHCANPPCVPVCPTGATHQRDDGVIVMDYDACIGCGYCAVACPYQARTIAHEPSFYFGSKTRQENAAQQPQRAGVAQKCTFCMDRIDEAQINGLSPGVDAEVTPACASSCIASAIQFGDFNDPSSLVSSLRQDQSATRMHESLGTDPQIHYLYETPTIRGRDNTQHTNDVGPRQTFWDWRAASNFILGGLSSGFAFSCTLLYGVGEISAKTTTIALSIAAIVMLIGLAAVFLEIGRKLRALFVFRRPQTSWMTREAFAAFVFIVATIAAAWSSSGAAIAVAGLAALGFLYCQGRILQAGMGIPAWRAPEIPSLLVLSGLIEGLVLAIAFTALAEITAAGWWAMLALGCLVVAYSLRWHQYLINSAWAEPTESLLLSAKRNATLVVILASIATVIALLLFSMAPVLARSVLVAASILVIAGSWFWKSTVITRASFFQAVTLPTLPARGSGNRRALAST